MPNDPAATKSETANTESDKTPLRLRIFNFLGTPIFCILWLMGMVLRVDWRLEAHKPDEPFQADMLADVLAKTATRAAVLEMALKLVDRVVQEHTNQHDGATIYILPEYHRKNLATFIASMESGSQPTPDSDA